MKKYFYITLACAVLVAGISGIAQNTGPAAAQAALPQILINWQADTYTPAGWGGKALPTADARLAAGVDLIDQGRRINLSGQRVFWYINESFYQGGPGVTRIAFTAPHFIGRIDIQVRVTFPDYPGAPGKTVNIPVVPPEIVIGSSAPSLAASAAPFTLQAYPYFWNVRDALELQYTWTVNGAQAGAQNPFTVTRDMAAAGRPVQLELRVANPSRVIERTTNKLTLFPEQ